MNELNYEVIKLLINAGLIPEVAEELADRIDVLYREARRQDMVRRGAKGGQASAFKAINELKRTNPKRYKQIIKARADKRRQTMLDKNANA